MGTVMPVDASAARNARTMRSRSAAVASIGTRSLSWKFTPQAPISASLCTARTGSSGGRTNSPNGSRPRFPTVHRPKVNLSAGVGVSVMTLTVEIDVGSGDEQQHDRGVDHVPPVPAPPRFALLIGGDRRVGQSRQLVFVR